jgi:hypothetical protein
MSGKRSGQQPARDHRLLIATTEKHLRSDHVLAADDQIIELKAGQVRQWIMAGASQPIPPAYGKLDIPLLRGMCSCGYSKKRLIFGSKGTLFANLEFVWQADSCGRMLRVVFSSPRLNVVRWRSYEDEDDALAGFAERILTQRDGALASLPAESRQRAADHLAVLTRSGMLAAALAEQEAPHVAADPPYPDSAALPRTYVGRWLRAAMLDQRELRDQLATTLDRRREGWNDDVLLVAEIASTLVAPGYFGPVPTEDEIVWLAEIIHQTLASERRDVDAQAAQALIKSALGSADSVDINRGDRFVAVAVMVAFLSQLLHLQQTTADTLIREAERMAFERGAHPPLAPHKRLPA